MSGNRWVQLIGKPLTSPVVHTTAFDPEPSWTTKAKDLSRTTGLQPIED